MSACNTGAAPPTTTTAPQPTAAAAAQPTTAPATPTTAPAAPTATAVPATPTTPPKPARTEVILATTTSTRDTGLLDVLIPDFEKKTGYTVKPIAVGTGAALAMGQRGEADVLLVHAPASEKELMAAGHGASRSLVMHNDFVFVGPKDDPAGIKGTAKAVDALKMIAEKQSLFISRGDDSGTDKMEKSLWKTAGVEPGGSWYQESGQGMGATLRIASEKAGYTLTDRGTYLSLKKTLGLDVMVEGDPVLLNVYSVIPVNKAKHPDINAEGGQAFADYMVAPETQEIIKNYGVDKFGEPLFKADADKKYEDLGLTS